MAEQSTDDKIARLVHLVLEAVDQRLAAMRGEMQQLVARLDAAENQLAGAQPSAAAGASDGGRLDRLATELRAVRAELAALTDRAARSETPTTAPTAAAAAAVSAAPSAAPTPAVPAATPTLPLLSAMTPLTPLSTAMASPTSGPEVAASDDAEPAAPAPAARSDHGELIDLDKLGDLLTARLGQLNLPRSN